MKEEKCLFEKFFNEEIDKSIKDLLELFLTERICRFFRNKRSRNALRRMRGRPVLRNGTE